MRAYSALVTYSVLVRYRRSVIVEARCTVVGVAFSLGGLKARATAAGLVVGHWLSHCSLVHFSFAGTAHFVLIQLRG